MGWLFGENPILGNLRNFCIVGYFDIKKIGDMDENGMDSGIMMDDYVM